MKRQVNVRAFTLEKSLARGKIASIPESRLFAGSRNRKQQSEIYSASFAKCVS
jgi:hypothetical protein